MQIGLKIEDIRSLIGVKPTHKTPDEINDTRTSRLTDDMIAENWKVLENARQYWESLSDFRERRRRARRYLSGDQWGDLITDDDGNTVTEEDYIKSQGKIPFKQNIIRQLERSIVGQYRTNKPKSVVISRKRKDTLRSEMLTNALQSAKEFNNVSELDVSNLEEFIISGMVIGKTTFWYNKDLDREEVLIENIHPNTIFFNTDVKDPRLSDLRMIGEIKDCSLDYLVSAFANNEDEEQLIRSWYTNVNPRDIVVQYDGLTADRMDNIDFYNPSDTNMVRFIEVWELVSDWRTYVHDYSDGSYVITKKSVKELEKENLRRIEMGKQEGIPLEEIPLLDIRRKKEQFWTVKILTPYGQCLYQGETVYKHQSHPYTMVLYPLIDGKVWGLVEDIIDQQRYINRLISLHDFIMGSSAKGVLLVPEEVIPKDMDITDFADEWSRMNGVIKFKAKPGVPLPKQISSNLTNIGINEMLQLQMKLIQDIAGVSGAIQGHQPNSGTPASLYAQQALNSSINLRDLFSRFSWFQKLRDMKTLKVIQQFYTDKRYIAVAGARYEEAADYYDPDMVKDTEFDMVIEDGVNNPVYRMAIDDQLFQLFKAQAIDVKTYLENSGLPFAEKILESIEKAQQQKEEAMQQAQQMQGQPQLQGQPQQEQIQQGEPMNPQKQEVINRLMSGVQKES